MAIGIFVLDALQQIPLSIRGVTELAAVGLLAIWVTLARSYAVGLAAGGFSTYVHDAVEGFAVGTWVPATCVLGQVMLSVIPGWRPASETLWLLAVMLWIWFLAVAIRGYRAIVVHSRVSEATGRVLLLTVSTQSLAILTASLFPSSLLRGELTGLVILGCVFYAAGATLVALRYVRPRAWALIDEWDNSNCILHGAMSITGLAAILTGALPGSWIVAIWVWVVLVFIVVESVELARARARVSAYGWRQGLLTYDVSQWSRNFTFGMLYAFSLHLRPTLLQADHFSTLIQLRSLMVGYGQYVVLVMLCIEISLFVQSHAHLGRRIQVPAPIESGTA